jgi:predicted transcriptional regulator
MRKEDLAKVAADIVITYLSSGNKVPARDMGILKSGVCDVLNGFGLVPAPPPAPELEPDPALERWKPAVPVRLSLRSDAIICLVCGKERLTLRRHLGVAHGLSPEQYRERFDLWDDYPMDAAVYTKVRSDLAKARGLGKTILWADRPCGSGQANAKAP